MDAFNKVIYNADVCVVVRVRKGGGRNRMVERVPLFFRLCQGVPPPLTQGLPVPIEGEGQGDARAKRGE